MSRVLQVLVEDPRPCSYLDDRDASLEHRVMLDVSVDELDGMLARGWRRFGPDYFRPACGGCESCIPTRVPVATFAPSKSQRRAMRACASLRVEIDVPRVDQARIELYRAWHAERELSRGWEAATLDAKSYFLNFAFPHPAAREITYWDGRRLVGVGLCDETPGAWSAIYFFYAPQMAQRSLGVANVLTQIDLARERGIPHLYLGFRVAGCPSMAYKGGFQPQERLVGWPGPTDAPRWEPCRPK